MKKGMTSQVFIYIFIVIVMAMVLLFGFKQIVNIQNLNQKSVYLEFKSDFKDAVSNVYYKNKGSVLAFSKDSRNKPLILPNDVEQVCFDNSNVNILPYDSFVVDFLTGNLCIGNKNGLSFRLENVVINSETFVTISEI
jgi:hypothetical protein